MPFDFDMADFAPMVNDLAAIAGQGSNSEQALYTSVGRVLDVAIEYTPISTEADLVERVTASVNLDFARYDLLTGDGVLTTNQGTRGTAGVQWVREGGVNYIMRGGNRRWSAARWGRYQAANAQREADLAQSLRIRTQRAKKSIGLTQQSWVQSGDDLGVTLHAAKLGEIRTAVASDGSYYENGRGYPDRSADLLELVVENGMPLLVRGDGALILQRAIYTREEAFRIEMQTGALLDLDNFQRRYPGLHIGQN